MLKNDRSQWRILADQNENKVEVLDKMKFMCVYDQRLDVGKQIHQKLTRDALAPAVGPCYQDASHEIVVVAGANWLQP